MVLADRGVPRGLMHGASGATASEPVAVRDFLVALYYWLETVSTNNCWHRGPGGVAAVKGKALESRPIESWKLTISRNRRCTEMNWPLVCDSGLSKTGVPRCVARGFRTKGNYGPLCWPPTRLRHPYQVLNSATGRMRLLLRKQDR
jgi:hypothetical protein